MPVRILLLHCWEYKRKEQIQLLLSKESYGLADCENNEAKRQFLGKYGNQDSKFSSGTDFSIFEQWYKRAITTYCHLKKKKKSNFCCLIGSQNKHKEIGREKTSLTPFSGSSRNSAAPSTPTFRAHSKRNSLHSTSNVRIFHWGCIDEWRLPTLSCTMRNPSDNSLRSTRSLFPIITFTLQFKNPIISCQPYPIMLHQVKMCKPR